MLTINGKQFQTACQGRNVIPINKTKQKIVVVYDGIKRVPNFQKGNCRGLKRQKNSWVSQSKCVF